MLQNFEIVFVSLFSHHTHAVLNSVSRAFFRSSEFGLKLYGSAIVEIVYRLIYLITYWDRVPYSDQRSFLTVGP